MTIALNLSYEEAYIESLSLPSGLDVTAGRYLIDAGYLNPIHQHEWDFVDAPLVYLAFFNRQYIDDGLRVRWLAPTDFYLLTGYVVPFSQQG
ncbi:MAG: hypothetical protein V3V61_04055 [Gammaproteobacteria bacterium]